MQNIRYNVFRFDKITTNQWLFILTHVFFIILLYILFIGWLEHLNVFFSEVQNGHGLAAFAALSPVGKKIIIIVFVFLISFEKDIYLKLMPKTLNHLQAKTQLCIPFHRLRLSLKFWVHRWIRLVLTMDQNQNQSYKKAMLTGFGET